MSNNDPDEVAKRVEAYEKSLPDTERNPKAKQGFENLIERASQPLPKGGEKRPTDGRYSGKQTRSRKTGDTSD